MVTILFFFFPSCQQESPTANTAALWRWSALSSGCSRSRSSPLSTMAAGLAGKLWRRSLVNGSWRLKLSTNYQVEKWFGAELLLITIITALNAVDLKTILTRFPGDYRMLLLLSLTSWAKIPNDSVRTGQRSNLRTGCDITDIEMYCFNLINKCLI